MGPIQEGFSAELPTLRSNSVTGWYTGMLSPHPADAQSFFLYAFIHCYTDSDLSHTAFAFYF